MFHTAQLHTSCEWFIFKTCGRYVIFKALFAIFVPFSLSFFCVSSAGFLDSTWETQGTATEHIAQLGTNARKTHYY